MIPSIDSRLSLRGLHNVQRFAGRPNSPFSNLGFNPNRPRRGGIGPLSDHEARQLVEEPCSLLGFRFEQLAVDKILSYTNRHPSLIQFFCHELIQTWRTDHLDGKPPFHVGIADVDKVYRKKSIQEGIRRRFEETFKLDPRYHVISLTMIYFQERPTQKWTMEELRECCQCWCPLTFDPDNLEGLELRSLLDELVGLGILAEDASAYRMRSSLISQMFGGRAEVERTLQELEAAEPLEDLNRTNGHWMMDLEEIAYSLPSTQAFLDSLARSVVRDVVIVLLPDNLSREMVGRLVRNRLDMMAGFSLYELSDPGPSDPLTASAEAMNASWSSDWTRRKHRKPTVLHWTTRFALRTSYWIGRLKVVGLH